MFDAADVFLQISMFLIFYIFVIIEFVIFSLWDRNSSSLSYRTTESLLNPPGLGVRCVNGGYLQ